MLLIAIVLVSSVLSIASGIGIDGWVSIQGSDPTLTAVDISAKGNDTYILGSDGAIHFWSVSALTPDGDWQYVDESNGGRQTTGALVRIATTVDGCVWTVDNKNNIAVYDSNALGWHTITGGPHVTWIAAQYCNGSAVVVTDVLNPYPPWGNGNTIFFYYNHTWTQVFDQVGHSCTSTSVGIGEKGERLYTITYDIWNAAAPSPPTGTSVDVSMGSQQGKKIDGVSLSRIIVLDANNSSMLLWNGSGWTALPGGPAKRATISQTQVFYIDLAGNAYSANITP